MTLLDTKSYFEGYATRHLLLQHDQENEDKHTFFCLNTEEKANDYIRDAKMDLIMVLMPYDKSMLPVTAENYNWNKNLCFMILKRCDNADNNGIIEAQSICETIADDFCTVMINDRFGKLTSIDTSSITMSPVGPVVDSHYGYICLFNLIDSFNHWVDPHKWKPE